jgi:hypothetical protein
MALRLAKLGSRQRATWQLGNVVPQVEKNLREEV